MRESKDSIVMIVIVLLMWAFLFPLMAEGQEVRRLASWDNAKIEDLGGGRFRSVEIMARPWYVEYERNRNGNIVEIRNISRGDTISYIPSGFSGYFGQEVDGNWVDNFEGDGSESFEITVKSGGVDVRGDTVSLSRKGRLLMEVLNIRGFDAEGKAVGLRSLVKDGNKIRGEFKEPVRRIDPTWSWQPDAAAGLDNQILSGNGADVNYGTGGDLNLGLIAGSYPIRRILITLSAIGDSIPSGATVTSGRLILTASSMIGTPPAVYAFPLKRNWVETEATYNIYSTGNSWQTAGATGANDIYTTGADTTTTGMDWVGIDTVDVTNYATNVSNESRTNYGILLKSATEIGDNGVNWYSSDVGGASNRPKIEIDYTTVLTSDAPTVATLSDSSFALTFDDTQNDSTKVYYGVRDSTHQRWISASGDTTSTWVIQPEIDWQDIELKTYRGNQQVGFVLVAYWRSDSTAADASAMTTNYTWAKPVTIAGMDSLHSGWVEFDSLDNTANVSNVCSVQVMNSEIGMWIKPTGEPSLDTTVYHIDDYNNFSMLVAFNKVIAIVMNVRGVISHWTGWFSETVTDGIPPSGDGDGVTEAWVRGAITDTVKTLDFITAMAVSETVAVIRTEWNAAIMDSLTDTTFVITAYDTSGVFGKAELEEIRAIRP